MDSLGCGSLGCGRLVCGSLGSGSLGCVLAPCFYVKLSKIVCSIKFVPAGANNTKCSECKENFKDESQLRYHVKKEHNQVS